MNQTLEKLQNIQKNGYQIDFERVFNHAFENYKKIALYAGSVLIIFVVLFGIFTSISLVSILGLTNAQEISPENFKIENISQETLMIMGVVSIFVSCLLSPFQAAFLKMADHGDRDKEFLVSNLFSFYNFPYIKEIITATFLITFSSFLQATILTYAKLELLGSLISYFISFITILTVPLIIFGNLKAVDAIKYSVQIVFKQPLILFALILIAIIGALVGLIACCIGIFFTMPFIYSMNYAIYNEIIGIDNTVDNE